jgi:ADP-heptose:LPS heptosyltransferase
MGIGDDVMLTAKFRNLKRKYPDKNFVPVHRGELRWSPVYENNPNFIHPSKINSNTELIGVEIRPNGLRPYLGATNQRDAKGIYSQFIELYPQKGDICLTDEEIQTAKKLFSLPEKYVTIDPHTKTSIYSSNRDWGFHKWQEVVDHFSDVTFIQTSPGKSLIGKNVYLNLNTTLRLFFAVLSQSKFHVGNEGGPIHSATALNKRCVVVFGGLSMPSSTGYETNINHWVDDPETPCGRTYECEHCKRCMEKITVEQVIESIEILKRELY